MPCQKFATLRLFVMTMPIQKAVATGNGNIEFNRETARSIKITLDRHNAIQNLNYYDLPDPRHFLLPSTFKHIILLNKGAFLEKRC